MKEFYVWVEDVDLDCCEEYMYCNEEALMSWGEGDH